MPSIKKGMVIKMNETRNDEEILAFRDEIPDYVTEIVEIIKSLRENPSAAEKILEYHENDIAEALDELDKNERMLLYTSLDTETLSEIFEYSESRSEYLEELSTLKQAEILSYIEPAVAAEYLDELECEEREEILNLVDNEAKDEIELLSSFTDEEIGSRMSRNYISVEESFSIKEAMKALVDSAAENDNISTIYVTDKDEHLLGAIRLPDLIIAREGDSLSDITMTSYPFVYANEKTEDCMARIKDYSEDSIPLTDEEGRLIGVILAEELVELVDDEISEDYAKLAGLSDSEDLSEPLWRSIGKRLPWLAILLGLGLIVSSVVGIFEHVVEHLTLIICFQSLILGMAGNAGTQSLAITIRVLSDEELSSRDKLFLIIKESRVGVINGIILGILSFAFIGLYIMLFKGEGASYAFLVSMCTAIALAVSVLLSSITGTIIPLIFKRLKIDPAVASGPLITTINDLVAVIAYYGLAWVLLINVFGL